MPRVNEWAISYRKSEKLPTHNVNTTNYVEVSFRIDKEILFNRTMCYNLGELLDVVLDDSSFYSRKCVDVGNY